MSRIGGMGRSAEANRATIRSVRKSSSSALNRTTNSLPACSNVYAFDHSRWPTALRFRTSAWRRWRRNASISGSLSLEGNGLTVATGVRPGAQDPHLRVASDALYAAHVPRPRLQRAHLVAALGQAGAGRFGDASLGRDD